MLQDLVNEFLEGPYPLWEIRLTHELVQKKLDYFRLNNIAQTIFGYNTVNSYFKDNFEYPVVRYQLDIPSLKPVFLEQPSLGYLHSFYGDHGLELLPIGYFSTENILAKLNRAFHLMKLVPECFNCVTDLVMSIQVLKTDDPEIDVSYSHPEIPFSIFVSLCDENCIASDLRVCESILHEAMHLKLTLIENIVPIVEINSQETFYSPWRDEARPIKGVLHGLFVFRAILDFYRALYMQENLLNLDKKSLSSRISQINNEIETLANFSQCNDITEVGRSLVIRLTQPLNL